MDADVCYADSMQALSAEYPDVEVPSYRANEKGEYEKPKTAERIAANNTSTEARACDGAATLGFRV